MSVRYTLPLLPVVFATALQASVLEEVVVTASRAEQTIESVPTNITVVGSETLDLIGHTHINEALARVSGAWISRGNGQEHLTALRSPVLTGAGACGAFLLMEDGIPLRASGFCNVNELFHANSEQARAIEVIKGPAGVTYGSNAMHGLVNILTPEPSSVRRAGMEGGPHGYIRGKISLGTDAFRIDANGAHDGGYKDDSGFDQQKLTIKHRRNVGEWTMTAAISATNLNQETAGFIDGPEVYKSDLLRTVNPNPEAYRDTHAVRSYLRFERTDEEGNRIILTPYARKTDMNFIQHFLPGQAIEENGHTSLGVQSGWYGEHWTVGADVEFSQGYLRESQPNATAGSAFLVATIPAGDHYDYDVDAQTLAAFLERRLDLSSNTQVTAGVRAEFIRYDYDNQMIDGRTRDDGVACGFGGCRFNRPADRSDSFLNLSPKLGIKHSVSENAQVYAYLARGFRAPQTTELYRLQNDQSVSDIDSEELDSLEFGYRGGDDQLAFDVAGFLMRKDNFIFRDTTRTNVDNGKTSHRGVELGLSALVTEDVRINLNWSYAIHRYDNNPALATTNIEGNDIDTAPRHMGTTQITWRPLDRLFTELEWVHLGKYYEDEANLNPYEGHDLLNLRLRAGITDSIEAFVRVTNLTDTKYAERADFAFGSDRYFVGEPRSVYVGVTADF